MGIKDAGKAIIKDPIAREGFLAIVAAFGRGAATAKIVKLLRNIDNAEAVLADFQAAMRWFETNADRIRAGLPRQGELADGEIVAVDVVKDELAKRGRKARKLIQG